MIPQISGRSRQPIGQSYRLRLYPPTSGTLPARQASVVNHDQDLSGICAACMMRSFRAQCWWWPASIWKLGLCEEEGSMAGGLGTVHNAHQPVDVYEVT